MSQLDPTNTTVGDICAAALKESGAIGTGQTPSAEDSTDAWARLQWMLQQWERKRFLVYHLVTYSVVSTGALSYTVGPGGAINTNAAVPGANPFNTQFGPQFGSGVVQPLTVRPDRIESAFLRQLNQQLPNGQGGNPDENPSYIDYYLEIIQSMEDYNKIALKNLQSFPGFAFYDPAWPLGLLYAWPVPQANIYSVNITIKEQLPIKFPTLATAINLPYEYYGAMVYNLALRLRPKYGIPTPPGDELLGLAKDSLAVLRGSNTAIARLQIPPDMARSGIYNIFSDRFY